jgi:hypothetical protein
VFERVLAPTAFDVAAARIEDALLELVAKRIREGRRRSKAKERRPKRSGTVRIGSEDWLLAN